MCILTNVTINEAKLNSLAMWTLPFIMSLYLGHGNIYKVLFFILISYIILITVIIVKGCDMNLLENVIIYEDEFGKMQKTKYASLLCKEKNEILGTLKPEQIKGMDVKFIDPNKEVNVHVPDGLFNKVIDKIKENDNNNEDIVMDEKDLEIEITENSNNDRKEKSMEKTDDLI